MENLHENTVSSPIEHLSAPLLRPDRADLLDCHYMYIHTIYVYALNKLNEIV